MLYTTLTVKNTEYKLRLTSQMAIELERRLGRNPLAELMTISETKLPSIETLVLILHYSLQAYQSNISIADTYNIYDNLVDDGKALEDILQIILDILKVSGFIKADKANSKN